MTVRAFALGALATCLFSALPAIADEAWLIRNASIVDGTGAPAYSADVRIRSDRITAIGKLSPRRGETVVDAAGLVLAPGFIDTHSHHERGLEAQPEALPVVAQGVTTIVINQDGFGSAPLEEVFSAFAASPAAVNIAAFSGHNYIRSRVMKDDASRPATPGEIEEMRALVHADMRAPRTDDACNASHRLRGYPGRSVSCQQCPARKWELPHPAGHTAEEVQTELARVIADPMVTVSRVAPVWPAGKMPPPDIRIINAAE